MIHRRKFTISLLDFIRTGKFGNVEIGMTKIEIRKLFPKPDDACDNIWCYSTFEFLFDEEELLTLWCDWLSGLKSPRKKQFKLDRSFINYSNNTVCEVMKRLLKEGITFSTVGKYFSKDVIPSAIVLTPDTASSVRLYFEPQDDRFLYNKNETEITELKDYTLIAIGSTHISSKVFEKPLDRQQLIE